MKVFVHKEHLGVQTYPEPEDKTNWYEVEVDSEQEFEGKVYNPSTSAFVPDVTSTASTVRQQRDNLLSTSDWVVIKSQETEQPVPPEWVAYRQALRDITDQPGFPLDVVWPTAPGGN
jgi:hypothetical protein